MEKLFLFFVDQYIQLDRKDFIIWFYPYLTFIPFAGNKSFLDVCCSESRRIVAIIVTISSSIEAKEFSLWKNIFALSDGEVNTESNFPDARP